MHPLEPPSIVRCRAIAAEMDETAGSRFPCKSARPNLRTLRAIDPATNGDRLAEVLQIEAAAAGPRLPSTRLGVARISEAMKDGLQTPEHDREFEAFFDRY
jgi:hypothetical protein